MCLSIVRGTICSSGLMMDRVMCCSSGLVMDRVMCCGSGLVMDRVMCCSRGLVMDRRMCFSVVVMDQGMCCSSGMFMCSVSRYRVTRVAHKSGSCLGKTSRHRSAWTSEVKFWTPWFVTWGLIRFEWSRVWSFVSKDWRNVRCVCGVVRTT